MLKTIWFTITLFITLSASTTLASEEGDELAQQMLERLGGKSKWAALKNTINGSMQYRSTAPTAVYAVITMDFTKPRIRFDTTATDINLIRVINGSSSWRISWSGQVEDLPAESLEQDLAWYQAHLYRTIHRIAIEDPKLTLKVSNTNQLDVFSGESRLIWFRLTQDAEPYAFGVRDDENGSLSGPWIVERNGIRHPAWVSSHDGTWRAAIRSLEINVPLHDSTFRRPESESK